MLPIDEQPAPSTAQPRSNHRTRLRSRRVIPWNTVRALEPRKRHILLAVRWRIARRRALWWRIALLLVAELRILETFRSIFWLAAPLAKEGGAADDAAVEDDEE